MVNQTEFWWLFDNVEMTKVKLPFLNSYSGGRVQITYALVSVECWGKFCCKAFSAENGNGFAGEWFSVVSC